MRRPPTASLAAPLPPVRRSPAPPLLVPPTLVLAVVLALLLPPTGASASASTVSTVGSAASQVASDRVAQSGTDRLSRVLTLVNQARERARRCGERRHGAVPPLRRHARLDRAADGHAHHMARRDFFSHDSPDGSTAGDRIRAAGYDWTSYAENIAAGYGTPRAVVSGWLGSPGHCSAIMGRSREVGLGYALDESSTYGTYWVLDFGTR